MSIASLLWKDRLFDLLLGSKGGVLIAAAMPVLQDEQSYEKAGLVSFMRIVHVYPLAQLLSLLMGTNHTL